MAQPFQFPNRAQSEAQPPGPVPVGTSQFAQGLSGHDTSAARLGSGDLSGVASSCLTLLLLDAHKTRLCCRGLEAVAGCRLVPTDSHRSDLRAAQARTVATHHPLRGELRRSPRRLRLYSKQAAREVVL
mgnify:CR=1 FL=1